MLHRYKMKGGITMMKETKTTYTVKIKHFNGETFNIDFDDYGKAFDYASDVKTVCGPYATVSIITKINKQRGEKKVMTTREEQEVIDKALSNFVSNMEYAYEVGETMGTFAKYYAIDKAWDTLEEDIEVLDFSDNAKKILYETALHMIL